MYKKACKFFQKHKGLLVTTGKPAKKRKRKRKYNKGNGSKVKIDRLKLKLIKLFPQKDFRLHCKYNFDGIKVFLYKSRTPAGHTDILVVVNPGPLRTLRIRHKRLIWNPSGTDKISVARLLLERGFTYKGVMNYLNPEKKESSERVSLRSG